MRVSATAMGRATTGRPAVAAPTSPPRLKFELLQISIALLTVMSVSRVHQQFGFLSTLRPGLLLIGLALAAAVLNPRAVARWKWARRWQSKAVAAFILASFGSIVFGISQGGAFHAFSTYYYKVLVFAVLFMVAIRNVRDLSMIVWAYVIGCGVLVYMTMFVYKLEMQGAVSRLSNLETWDANDIGVLLLIGLPLTLLVFQTAGKKGKLVAGAILLGIGSAIARSGSRGAFLGAAVVVLAYLLSLKGVSVPRRVAFVTVLAGALAISAPPGYWQQMNTIKAVDNDYNWNADQGRRQLAIRGMKYMLDYPVFGIGIGNFGRAEAFVSDLRERRGPGGPGVKWSAAHNSYVQAGAELGIPGLILFVGIVVGCIVAPWRLRRRIPSQWKDGEPDQRFLFHAATYLPLASLGFAVPAAFVSFTFAEPIFMLAALTCALAGFAEARLGAGKQRGRHPRAQRATARPAAMPQPAL